MVLVFFGVFSRFWIVQLPRYPVLGEDRCIHTVNSYINGSFFLDYEPPFGTLLMTAIANAAGYDASYMIDSRSLEWSFPDMQYVVLRSGPAFCSAISIIMSFLIVRSLGGSRLAAFASGFFFLCDFSLIGLSRYALGGGFLQLFLSSMVLMIAIKAHFRRESSPWLVFVVVEAIFAGCCASTRVCGVSVCVLLCIVNRKNVTALVLDVVIPIVMFVGSFCVQVFLMPFTSRWANVLPESYKMLLVNPGSPVVVDHSTILSRAFRLIVLMFQGRPDRSSNWWKLPLMINSWTVMWARDGRVCALFGNVAIWWSVVVVVVLALAQLLASRKLNDSTHMLTIGYVLAFGFFVAFNSEINSDYQIALLFGVWLLPLFIDVVSSQTVSGFVLSALIAISGFLFVIWAPLIYGYEGFDSRFLPYFAQ